MTLLLPTKLRPVSITLAGIENVLKLNGESWRGEWQVEACRAIVENPEVIIQGPRQAFGKTFCNASAGAAMIINNHTVIVGFPTLSQGTRLLNREISNRVNRVGQWIGGWTMDSDTVTDKLWNSQEKDEDERSHIIGRLLTLTANESTKSKPEGYTGDDEFLDEAHRLTDKSLGVFSPFLNVARRERRHKLVLSGIGGHKNSLIERAKDFTRPGTGEKVFKIVRFTAEDILRIDPTWRDVFDLEKAILPEWQWLTNYMVEPAAEGLRYMYPDPLIPPDVTQALNKNYQFIYYAGIDIGYVEDATVVTIYRKIGDYIIIKCQLVLRNVKIQEKVKRIMEFLNAEAPGIEGRRIGVELNGGGFDLRDMLDEKLSGVQGVTTDAAMKEDFFTETTTKARDGIFGIEDEEIRQIWGDLLYEVKMSSGKKKMEFEHSDHWMSAMVGWQLARESSRRSTIFAVQADPDPHDYRNELGL